MKFLHTSDWHFGINLHGLSIGEEHENFLRQLFRIVEEEAADAVLIAGDIYDSSVASAEAIRLYHFAMEELCIRRKCPVFVIAGNHDSAVRLAAIKELVRPSGLFVSGTIDESKKPILLGNTAIYQIPYFQLSNLRAMAPNRTADDMQQAMEIICESIRENMDKSKTNILMAHAFAGGAVLTESDRSAAVGGTSVISADVFRGFDYVALGHLHRAQNVGDKVRYSGSPLAYSFGEAGISKSVTLFDTDTGEISVREIKPLHLMRVIRGSYDEVMNGEETGEDYIKVEFTDRSAEREAMERLKMRYPNLLTVTGKAPQSERETAFSEEEAEKLSPGQILRYFFEDIYGESVTREQESQWETALKAAEEDV